MLLNYLLLAFRNIIKQRGFAVVNMFGLALGLASALFILLYVKDELTYDTMHPDATNTYRMGYVLNFANGEKEAAPYAPAGWDNYIQANYPGVGGITSYDTYGMPTSLHNEKNDRTLMTEDMVWAEPSFAQVIYLPIVKGDRNNPLKELNSIVLTESTAKELFGNEDPINKSLIISHTYATRGNKIEMMVTAISKDLPSNSHVNPKFVANVLALKPYIEDLENKLNTSMGDNNGNNYFSQSYFICTNPEKIPSIQADLQKKANDLIAKNKWDFKFTPVIRKITDIHFDKEMDWTIDHKTADIKSVYVFITIAILILMVACINYINLSTAKSASRAREIGLRKTFGGVRAQLFFQFMLESFILVLISALIAILLVLLFTPQFNNLTGKTFTLQHIMNGPMLLIIFGVIAFVTILAGSYPALFVSGFEPATVLKGKFAFRKGSNIFRQFLTTVQFVVAVTLLVGTVILVRQMSLMRDSKLNEAGKQIISIRYGGFTGPADNERYLVFKNAVQNDTEIENMTLANHLPRLDFFGPINMEMQFPEISEEKHQWFQLNGDYFFPGAFDLKIIAGRDFDPKNIADSTSVILNMSAVKALHLTAEEVVGKSIIRPELVNGYNRRRDTTLLPITGTVIGVVDDFPYRSMHKKIEPLAIAPKPHTEDRIIHIRLPQGKITEKIQFIEKTWKTVFPNFGFDYWFIDEEFGRMYESETKVAALTEKFSWLAILITCVGLYGLASFMSQQRIKEIGIRKTMGASNTQVLLLLLGVFGKLLLIACVIALPVAYYLTNQWLQGFEYRTPLSVFVFAGAIGLIAVITLLTVGYESLKASMSNPIKALRHE
ncbi:MAG: FtsX-like permease family protein [Cyclobacteriaceae bacterium]|nr:FtsX-like permease family protein [Cyclobacteriaceae bacterium]